MRFVAKTRKNSTKKVQLGLTFSGFPPGERSKSRRRGYFGRPGEGPPTRRTGTIRLRVIREGVRAKPPARPFHFEGFDHHIREVKRDPIILARVLYRHR